MNFVTTQQVIYMDNHATTRVDPLVVEVMLPWFDAQYGNPGSTTHAIGRAAADAVDNARHRIAKALGTRSREIVFTSGATESNNLALRGVALRYRKRGNHIIGVATEHAAVLEPLDQLKREGFEVTLIPVAGADSPVAGRIDIQQIADAMHDQTILVSIMLANNEIGVVQPVAEVAELCRAKEVLLHTDAAQAIGRIPVDVDALGVDLMSFSGHKMYGPKGVGGLFVRRRSPPVRLEAMIRGGGQERGLRSGTLNVPGIVGMARALELCGQRMSEEAARLVGLRRRLFEAIVERIPGVHLNGPALDDPSVRLPGNLNVSLDGLDAESLLLSTPQLAVSTGSACSTAAPEPSHVLRAIGLSEERIRGSVRFGLGRYNTEEEVDRAVDLLAGAAERLRAMGTMPP